MTIRRLLKPQILAGAVIATQLHRQLRPIEAELLTDPAHVARIEVLVRTTKRRLRRPPFSMYRHHDETLAAFLLRKVEATTLAPIAIFETLRFALLHDAA